MKKTKTKAKAQTQKVDREPILMTNEQKDLLKQLYIIRCFSGGEDPMRFFIKQFLQNNKIKFKLLNGNIIGFNHPGKPFISAHMDMVNTDRSAIKESELVIKNPLFTVDEKTCLRLYKNKDKDKKNQVSLGADDKNGIWVILELLKQKKKFNFILTHGEEIGGIGSNQIIESKELTDFISSCPYGLIIDRRNASDIIGYKNKYCLALDDRLEQFAEQNNFAYKTTGGLFSDADRFSRFTECVNLSCGYYEPHSSTEYTNLNELYTTLKFTETILDKFKYQSVSAKRLTDLKGPVYSYKSTTYNSYNNYKSDFYNTEEEYVYSTADKAKTTYTTETKEYKPEKKPMTRQEVADLTFIPRQQQDSKVLELNTTEQLKILYGSPIDSSETSSLVKPDEDLDEFLAEIYQGTVLCTHCKQDLIVCTIDYDDYFSDKKVDDKDLAEFPIRAKCNHCATEFIIKEAPDSDPEYDYVVVQTLKQIENNRTKGLIYTDRGQPVLITRVEADFKGTPEQFKEASQDWISCAHCKEKVHVFRSELLNYRQEVANFLGKKQTRTDYLGAKCCKCNQPITFDMTATGFFANCKDRELYLEKNNVVQLPMQIPQKDNPSTFDDSKNLKERTEPIMMLESREKLILTYGENKFTENYLDLLFCENCKKSMYISIDNYARYKKNCESLNLNYVEGIDSISTLCPHCFAKSRIALDASENPPCFEAIKGTLEVNKTNAK